MFPGYEWQAFLKEHDLISRVSRRGKHHNNALTESFLQLLKRERINIKLDQTKEIARSDILDYIVIYYKSKRKHSHAESKPPLEYKKLGVYN